jgi:thiosulfate dehydrogenase
VTLSLGVGACSRSGEPAASPAGPLISASTTMVTAWEVPKNPLTDATLDGSRLSEQVRWGYRIFMDTPHEAARFVPSKMSCGNCHLNAGQRERALPVVGIAGMFPEHNNRSGRLFSLADRIVDCFLRSENGTARAGDSDDATRAAVVEGSEETLASPSSPEVLAVAAYLTWLSKGYAMGTSPDWRGRNVIAKDKLIPVEKIDLRVANDLFIEKCSSCHGVDGQGVQIGDKKAGPLWGADSWNDGAGAARVYTLAGIIRYAMPYLDPGSLTDEEAQQLAAFINSQPRPQYPFKDRDYKSAPLPPDAVYYRAQP